MTGCKLKKTVTNVWLFNLAVADLVFCFTRVTSLLKNLFYTYWPFGEFLCKFNGFFKYMNMFCSVLILAVISLDRCFSVVFAIRMMQRRTVQMASFASVGVWALATVFSLPYFLFRQVSINPGNGNLSKCSLDVPGSKDRYQNKLALYILRFLIGFLVPFLIIVTCYAIMAWKLRRTRVPKKSFKIIAALVTAFFFCWAPYHVFLLAKMVNKKSLAVKVALPLFKGLAYFNSCINPVLYFLMALDLKKRMEISNITMSTKPLPQKTNNSVVIDYVMEMVLIVLYSITIILGVTGNSIVIWMTGCKLKKTVTNVWLFNLAVADLVFCFTRVTSLLKNLFYTYWPFGEFLCKFNGFFKYMNMFCSVLILAVISLDRCFSVVFAIRMMQRRTVQMASFASVGVWALATVFSLPYFLFRQISLNTFLERFHSLNLIFIAQTFQPLDQSSLASFASVGVWALATAFSLPYFLFRQVSMDPGNGNLSRCSFDVPGSNDGYQNKALYIVRFFFGFLIPFLIIATCYTIMACKLRQTRVPKKSFKIIAALVAAFFFCWAPYHVFLLAKMVNKKSLAVKVALPLFKGLAYFNSCINPILYFLMALDLKKRFNQTLSSVCISVFSEELDHFNHYRSTRRDRCAMANTVQVAAL
ncbi:UNVERIFIED_CONTAM: hypothetical protein FKN15_069257 [Acipenser sinensis]